MLADLAVGRVPWLGYAIPRMVYESVKSKRRQSRSGLHRVTAVFGLCLALGSSWAVARGGYIDAAIALRARAERGDPTAQVRLGDLYADGRGVPQSYDRARAWYCKALAQGHMPARRALEALGWGGRLSWPDGVETRCKAREKRTPRPITIILNPPVPSAMSSIQVTVDVGTGNGARHDRLQSVGVRHPGRVLHRPRVKHRLHTRITPRSKPNQSGVRVR